MVKERDNLLTGQDAFLTNREKLTLEKRFLCDEVYNEHVFDFEKGIRQCNYFFKVSLDHPGYDVMKTLVNGQLVDVPMLVATEESLPPSIEELQHVEVIVRDMDDEAERGAAERPTTLPF